MVQYDVEALDISKRFVSGRGLEHVALRSVNLRVRTGDIFGLFGPDGAGKTTIARILAGALAPTTGEVRVMGLDLARNLAKARESIGYLAAGGSRLYADLTVEENLAFFLDLHGITREIRSGRLAELIEFTGLEEHRRRLAGNLSGGMRQKLALACALVHEPDVLVLDEPSTGLDPLVRRDLWRRFYRLASGGTTIVLTTPYFDEAERCRTVGLLHGGRLIVQGSPQELAAPFSGRVLEMQSPTRARVKLRQALETVASVEMAYAVGSWVRAITSGPAEGVLAEVTHLLHALDLEIGLRPATPRLEDAFAVLLRKEESL